MSGFDSILVIGFGAPRRLDQILPFLRLVVRGRGVPDERLQEVAHHYEQIGGSPYNELAFRQVVALRRKLRDQYGFPVPVYGGMRNWHPFLDRVIRAMNRRHLQKSVGVILASHRSNTSLQRYQLDVAKAIETNGGVGPAVTYLDPWFDDPLFLEANAARIEGEVPYRRGSWPAEVPVLFTAHSIPQSMADGSPYVEDLLASCRGTAGILGVARWELAYQSRSGDGRVPWLEPDVCDRLRELAAEGVREVVVQPIGFLHDHVEVLYDLDVEAAEAARAAGIRMRRAGTVGDHDAFIEMLAQRILHLERAPCAGTETP